MAPPAAVLEAGGDAFVSFIASRTAATEDTVGATLNVEDLGVKPGVNGSVTITVTDSVGDGAEYTESYPQCSSHDEGPTGNAHAYGLRGHR